MSFLGSSGPTFVGPLFPIQDAAVYESTLTVGSQHYCEEIPRDKLTLDLYSAYIRVLFIALVA